MVPFGDDCEEPYDVYQHIVNSKQAFPSYFITDQNKKAAKMMQLLMKRAPEARHGGSYSIQKAHSWFEGVNWDGLIESSDKSVAPYIPPPNTLINMKSAKKQIEAGMSIYDELSKNMGSPRKKRSETRKPTIPDWDKGF